MDDNIQIHFDSGARYPFIPESEVIVSICERNSPEKKHVLELNSHVLVKYRNVSLEECRNQIEARKLLDPEIVYVPLVYRYFSKGLQNYLVMELVEGIERDTIEDDQSITKVAEAISHLREFQSNTPGPLGGGRSRGLFWENEETKLESKSRLEEYINRRLVGEQSGRQFKVNELVMNHNDIAPRNIIWMSNRSICLLDWSSAGYYPRLLELVVLLFNTQQSKDFEFARLLQQKLGPLTCDEEKEKSMMHMAWFNSHRYKM